MEKEKLSKQIDWVATIVPFIFVGILFIVFMIFPSQSKLILDNIRGFIRR